MRVFIIIIILSFCFLPAVHAENTISRIEIRGNKLISNSTIVAKLKIRAGQPYNENVINEDVKSLNATGFFDDISVEKQTVAAGVIVIFTVTEKLVAKKITIQGMRHMRKKKIEEVLTFKAGSFVDDYIMKESISKIRDLYLKKGFSQAEIYYEFKPIENREVEAAFFIAENKVIKVRKVIINGNKNISARKIRRIMKTRKAWLFGSGLFKDDVLKDDLKRVGDYYKLEGFSDVKVGTETKQQKKGIFVTLNITEGKRYYVGDVKMEGNENVKEEELKKDAGIKNGSIFSEYALYQESVRLREVYMDKGYVFSKIDPSSYLNYATEKMDVSFQITENELAYVEKIDIKGNIRTKDKVIRRQLRIYPNDRYDGKKIKKSKERLDNLGFFEEVRFDTQPGTEKNLIDLIVDVKESKTGSFSFGGGYSTIDQFVGFVELRQRNFDYKNLSTFTGAGQDISIGLSLGTLTKNYELSFTNPYVFDSPYLFGFDLFQREHKREEDVGYSYDEKNTGGVLRTGKEFTDTFRMGLAYSLQSTRISDVVDDASQELKDEVGTNLSSSVIMSLTYDSRDNIFAPNEGILFANSFQLTGGLLGGDKSFTKYFTHLGKFFPLSKKSVLELRLRAGFADPFDNTDKVPINERFFTGGASTVRGYEERTIGPVDSQNNDPIGGESILVGNIEYIYKLLDFLKVVAFYDAGNVWPQNNDFLSSGLKGGYGLGLRVKTPIGPISIDYGLPLNKVPAEEGKKGRLHFNISKGF